MTIAQLLLQAGTQPAPLLTNDLAGFAKLIGALVTVILVPLGALVVYFLKRGPDADIAAMKAATTKDIADVKADVNAVGGKVNAIEARQVATDERVTLLYSTIANSQRDIMEAIRSSGEAQIRAVHHVELEVARLQERANLGDCLATFGASIERLANAVTNRAT